MNEIIICPICIKKKVQKFSSLKNLNIHLARKHEVKYRFKVVGGEIRRVSCLIVPKLSIQT